MDFVDNKISEQRYNDFLISYCCGDFPNQRIGQAFINFCNGIHDPDLFYSRDGEYCWKRIHDDYVNWENR